jgi:hypothetical protein
MSLGADVIREVARDLRLPDEREGDAAKARSEEETPRQKRGGWFGLFG